MNTWLLGRNIEGGKGTGIIRQLKSNFVSSVPKNYDLEYLRQYIARKQNSNCYGGY